MEYAYKRKQIERLQYAIGIKDIFFGVLGNVHILLTVLLCMPKAVLWLLRIPSQCPWGNIDGVAPPPPPPRKKKKKKKKKKKHDKTQAMQ